MEKDERSITMPLGVAVERQRIDHPWQKWRWMPVAVIPGAPPVEGWKEIARGERFVRWHAATLQLELHRKETEAYKVNLSNHPPVIYVVLRTDGSGAAAHEVRPFRVTASPYEAQDYLDSGDDIVEGVPMPEGLIAWVQAFVDRHHVDEPFRKRRRDRVDTEALASSRGPERAEGSSASMRGRHGRA